MVMVSPATYKVSIDHARFVDEDAAADFQVELALWYSRHPPPLDAASVSWNLNAMANGSNRLTCIKEMASYPHQIFVIANVFRSSSAAEIDPEVLVRIDFAERNIGLSRVAFPFLRDRPARFYFVEDHLIHLPLGSSKHRLKIGLLQSIVGI